mgnify:FL=1
MTVIDLWNTNEDWTPFTAVEVYEIGVGRTYEYTYYEEVVKVFGNSHVHAFSMNYVEDKISIQIYDEKRVIA